MKTSIQLKDTLIPLFKSTYFGAGFIVLGIITQVLCFLFSDTKSTLSLISGILGILAVVLTSRRSMWFYLFGFLQLGTYLWICCYEKLWGEVGENIFYFITMIWGYFIWKRTYNGNEISTRSLPTFSLVVLFLVTGGITYALYRFFLGTSDSQPFMDSISTVPAIVAQMLMIFRYKEQWIFWAIIDIASIIMWIQAENYNMAFQFVFWTLNCFYGWIIWSEENY